LGHKDKGQRQRGADSDPKVKLDGAGEDELVSNQETRGAGCLLQVKDPPLGESCHVPSRQQTTDDCNNNLSLNNRRQAPEQEPPLASHGNWPSNYKRTCQEGALSRERVRDELGALGAAGTSLL